MLLGQGAFGKVVRAEAVGICGTDGTTIVAVKMPKGKNSVLPTGMRVYTHLLIIWHMSHSGYGDIIFH